MPLLSLPFVCWLDCQQHYTKTTESICMKLGWRMGLGLELTGNNAQTLMDRFGHIYVSGIYK